ncbi:hypothetical protein Tco_0706270 [Tanacetum coccineum]|uniref:Uncharacterized protein n=1 Tax=Tanacetum coccineum TaxID=301880 RepID=A0ABQ4Y6Y6_9ASTR
MSASKTSPFDIDWIALTRECSHVSAQKANTLIGEMFFTKNNAKEAQPSKDTGYQLGNPCAHNLIQGLRRGIQFEDPMIARIKRLRSFGAYET